MKKTSILIALAIATAGCNNTSTKTETASNDTSAKTEAPKLDSAAKMRNVMIYMAPGDMQKMLASMDGKWTGKVTSFWQGKSDTSTAHIENSMIMGGRFQIMKYKGIMMGQPFEGEGMLGYDNLRKVFTNTWADNMSTGIMYMEGPYNEATRTIELKGKGTNPETGGIVEMRQTMKLVDDKTQHMEMFMTMPGEKEAKMMEIDLSKK